MKIFVTTELLKFVHISHYFNWWIPYFTHNNNNYLMCIPLKLQRHHCFFSFYLWVFLQFQPLRFWIWTKILAPSKLQPDVSSSPINGFISTQFSLIKAKVEASTWHSRLGWVGHPQPQVLQHLTRVTQVIGPVVRL